MKHALIFIPFLLLAANSKTIISFEKKHPQNARKFHLHFVTVGFGSNMYEMEPVFKVDGTKFIYTSEEVWIYPKQTKIEKDTLLTGSFRTSSMDSISQLISQVKDSVIHKSNMRIMSGSAAYITIEDDFKKVEFDLHNTSNTTADRIVAILNTYIPATLRKLFICCGIKDKN